MGARSLAPMGHVRMMAACQPFLSGAISKTVNLPEIGDGRGDRGRLPPVVEARPQGDRGLPRQLQGRPAAVRRRAARPRRTPPTPRPPPTRPRPRSSRRSSTPRSASGCPKSRASPHHVVHRRWRRGLHDLRRPRRRPARRGLPQARQAGLDPGRRDGRLLDRGLDRPAVRRPAGDLRLEVHQPALRAGRPHRRPGRPDGAVDHGLHLPPPGPGLPVLRGPLGASASTPPRSASATSRPAPTSRSSRPARPAADDESLESEPTPRRSRSPRSRARSSTRPVETKDADGAEAREARPARPRRPTPRPSSSSRSPAHAVDSPALLHLRHQDAPRRLLLRLRGLRQHQRLQLSRSRQRAPRRSTTSGLRRVRGAATNDLVALAHQHDAEGSPRHARVEQQPDERSLGQRSGGPRSRVRAERSVGRPMVHAAGQHQGNEHVDVAQPRRVLARRPKY